MFQLTVSVDERKAEWLYSIEDIIKNKLNSCHAVAALKIHGKRVFCSFGCETENKTKLVAAVRDCIIEMFAVVAKFDFIKQNLSLAIPPARYDILLHTLVAFDRENEHKLLRKLVRVEDGIALDGFFNFRMGELKERWLEICRLTKSNGSYLRDDDMYNELLRFLISAVNPKVTKLVLRENSGAYSLSGALKNGSLDITAVDASELMYYLIDLAPLELVIDGGITNSELSRRLIGIFDAKSCDSCKNKTKKQ
ncbi:MAG: hypothetical protein J1G04_04525 [Clostridiales bacterium]|nr:hypothetical protein [Clostridiales bacterium]